MFNEQKLIEEVTVLTDKVMNQKMTFEELAQALGEPVSITGFSYAEVMRGIADIWLKAYEFRMMEVIGGKPSLVILGYRNA